MAAKHFIAPLCHDELGWMTFFFSGWVEATNRLCIFLGIRHFGQTSTQFHDPLQSMTAMLDAGCSSFVMIWFVLYSFFFNVLLLRLGGMELVNGGDLDAALGLLNGPGVDANGALAHRTTLCNETQMWSLLVTFKAFLGISRCLNSNFRNFEAQGSILFIIIGPGCGQWWEDRPKDVAESHILSRCLKSTKTKRNLWIIFDTFTSKQSIAKLQRLQPPNGLKLSKVTAEICWISRWDSAATRGGAWHQGRWWVERGALRSTLKIAVAWNAWNIMEPKNPEAQPFWDCNVNVMGVPSYINWLVQHEQKLQENGVTGMSSSLAANAQICAATR